MDVPRRTSRVDVARGVQLAVCEWGPADAEAIMLLHGGGLSSDEWTDVAPRLAERRRVVAFDARGCGESDCDPELRYGAKTIAVDLDRVRRALGVERFLLAGHSFGAVAACVYAADHPRIVTALVLIDGGPADHVRPAWLKNPPLSFASRDAAASALARSLPRGFPDWYLDTRFETQPDGTLTWRNDMRGRVKWSRATGEPLIPGLWPYVERLRMRTLVLHGAESPLFPLESAEEMMRVNPAITLVDVEEAGHFVHIDRPDAVVNAIEELA